MKMRRPLLCAVTTTQNHFSPDTSKSSLFFFSRSLMPLQHDTRKTAKKRRGEHNYHFSPARGTGAQKDEVMRRALLFFRSSPDNYWPSSSSSVSSGRRRSSSLMGSSAWKYKKTFLSLLCEKLIWIFGPLRVHNSSFGHRIALISLLSLRPRKSSILLGSKPRSEGWQTCGKKSWRDQIEKKQKQEREEVDFDENSLRKEEEVVWCPGLNSFWACPDSCFLSKFLVPAFSICLERATLTLEKWAKWKVAFFSGFMGEFVINVYSYREANMIRSYPSRSKCTSTSLKNMFDFWTQQSP